MPEPKTFPVYDETGCIGALLAPARFLDARSEKTIRLNSGEEISVPSAALKVQPDGSFRLLRTAAPPEAPTAVRERQASPNSGPQFASTAEPAAVPSLTPPIGAFFQDDYEIEHVPIGRIVDRPPTERHEGETLILPVMEEVLVYQKKIFLREEIRITRRRNAVNEVLRIEEEPAGPDPAAAKR
ncbi:MAG TPA: DUF2382 domain-containing protein [Bryobacteraceae bacterium]|nr:DUF2382 domain-containing protein [Bryobacteraceae bacterium]